MNPPPEDGAAPGRPLRPFDPALLSVLALGLLLRVAYVLAQPASDPMFGQPILDGALYTEWARALAEGGLQPQGAFYLAPGYAYVLAVLTRLLGPHPVGWLLVQQTACVVTAWVLAQHTSAVAGRLAGVAAATLFLLYPPTLFFASRPLGEWIGLLLLCCALAAVRIPAGRTAAAAGLLLGLAVLARPNLLLVGLAWIAIDARARRGRRALLLVTGIAIAVLPVTVRNLLVSGHPVLVSSNGGLTLYHGNGPGARGIYTLPAGFSGRVDTQREEAMRIARASSGRELDEVEADNWWGRRAIGTRLAEPYDSVRLLVRRAALTIDSHEHGLDYDPGLDRNPWRPKIRFGGAEIPVVPFALLLGLAAAGFAGLGVQRSGGVWSWSAVLACAATPLLFYVSSRYRLPAAALLAIPAGAGVAALVHGNPARRFSRWIALAALVAFAGVSLFVPSSGLARIERAGSLCLRASAHLASGDLRRAESDVLAAMALDPRSARASFLLGRVLDLQDRTPEARVAYRAALDLDAPGRVEAACNLAELLIREGQPGEAVAVSRRGLAERPDDPTCWTNLLVAIVQSGNTTEARRALERAKRWGVEVPAGLQQAILGGDGAGS